MISLERWRAANSNTIEGSLLRTKELRLKKMEMYFKVLLALFLERYSIEKSYGKDIAR